MMIKRRMTVATVVAVLGLVTLHREVAAEESAGEVSWDKILTASTFTGARDGLVAKGITLDVSLTQIGQGVVSGGKDGSWEYGGRGNITANVDTQKLGLWPGGFLMVEAEGNFADAVNGYTGALMPANTNHLFPVPGGDNFNLPQLAFAQFVSHYGGVVFGKLDTLTGDANEFAHGKGDTQFFNTALNINPVALSVPYSTLGGGAIILPTADPNHAIMNFLVLSAKGKASTPGFDDLDEESLIFSGEGRIRTDFFGLTGHQLVGGFFSNRNYISLDQRLNFAVENREIEKEDDTWAVYYNFDQFLYETDKAAGRGVGVFARFGASEGRPNPAQYAFSIGFGGKGVLARRPHDRFGIGYYYVDIKNPTLQVPFAGTRSFLRDEHGFEMFYNVAITPWMLLTPDLQVIRPSQKQRIITLTRREDVDTAVVLGVRLQMVF